MPGHGEFGNWHPGWGQEYRKTFCTVYPIWLRLTHKNFSCLCLQNLTCFSIKDENYTTWLNIDFSFHNVTYLEGIGFEGKYLSEHSARFSTSAFLKNKRGLCRSLIVGLKLFELLWIFHEVFFSKWWSTPVIKIEIRKKERIVEDHWVWRVLGWD